MQIADSAVLPAAQKGTMRKQSTNSAAKSAVPSVHDKGKSNNKCRCPSRTISTKAPRCRFPFKRQSAKSAAVSNLERDTVQKIAGA